jgi:hypothetical protein
MQSKLLELPAMISAPEPFRAFWASKKITEVVIEEKYERDRE